MIVLIVVMVISVTTKDVEKMVSCLYLRVLILHLC
jgi:hypothetical protein